MTKLPRAMSRADTRAARHAQPHPCARPVGDSSQHRASCALGREGGHPARDSGGRTALPMPRRIGGGTASGASNSASNDRPATVYDALLPNPTRVVARQMQRHPCAKRKEKRNGGQDDRKR